MVAYARRPDVHRVKRIRRCWRRSNEVGTQGRDQLIERGADGCAIGCGHCFAFNIR